MLITLIAIFIFSFFAYISLRSFLLKTGDTPKGAPSLTITHTQPHMYTLFSSDFIPIQAFTTTCVFIVYLGTGNSRSLSHTHELSFFLPLTYSFISPIFLSNTPFLSPFLSIICSLLHMHYFSVKHTLFLSNTLYFSQTHSTSLTHSVSLLLSVFLSLSHSRSTPSLALVHSIYLLHIHK